MTNSGMLRIRLGEILTHPALITLLLLPAVWVAAQVILFPGFRPDRPAIWATLALIAAFGLGWRKIWRVRHGRSGWPSARV